MSVAIDPLADPIDRRGMTTLVFVYGTLMSDGERGDLIRNRGGVLVRSGLIQGALYDFGDFPALVLGGGGFVEGEVWRCPVETLRALDTYEEVGAGLFLRVPLSMRSGTAWVYVAGPALAAEMAAAPRLHSGRWRDRHRERAAENLSPRRHAP